MTCVVKWCDEDGKHTIHRHYVSSLLAWRGRWLVGVNTVQGDTDSLHVELTASPRHGSPVIVPFTPDEAEDMGQAMIEAAGRASR